MNVAALWSSFGQWYNIAENVWPWLLLLADGVQMQCMMGENVPGCMGKVTLNSIWSSALVSVPASCFRLLPNSSHLSPIFYFCLLRVPAVPR